MIQLVPYVYVNGNWTAEDESIRDLFRTMVADGTINTVFYEGGMDSPEKLLALLKSPNNIPVIVMVDGVVGGLAWLNGVKNNFAFAHFCFFKNVWGKHSKEIGEELLRYWFSFPGKDGPLFDVLIGLIPAFNKHATRYTEDIGFVRLGEIPKMVRHKTSMVVLYKLRN